MFKHKLLLADDSITIQKVVNLTFADEGIEVVAVGDGDTALQKIKESAPDLVMADVNMPGLSGYQICETIKKTPEMRQIPVILLVGSFEPFDENEARRVGADDFMTKPFQSIRQLVTKVSNLLAQNSRVEEETPEANEQNSARSAAETDDPEEFADTLPDLKKPFASESKFSADDDEMIQSAQYESPALETTKAYSGYSEETEKPEFAYDKIHTVSDFDAEMDDEFSSGQARFGSNGQTENSYETSEDDENNSTGDIHGTMEMPEMNQRPAVYDFAENAEENKIADKSAGTEDLPVQEAEGNNQKTEIEQSKAEEIPAPPPASILTFDDSDLLELPPMESVFIHSNSAENAEMPAQIDEAIKSKIEAEAMKFSSTIELSSDAIEAIAQKVVEMLSEKFFDKEL